jgi:hypothetical protein
MKAAIWRDEKGIFAPDFRFHAIPLLLGRESSSLSATGIRFIVEAIEFRHEES